MKFKVIFAIAATVLALTACREAEEIPDESRKSPLELARDITLSVLDKEWNVEGDTKAFAIPTELGSGEYDLGLYYRNWKNHRFYGAGYSSEAIMPTRLEALSYRLSIPADCAEFSHDWCAVCPYFKETVSPDEKDRLSLTVYPVQHPTADGIDPVFNFVVSKPFKAGETEAEAESFKRMVAMLRVDICGLDSEESVFAASLKLGQAVSGTDVMAGKVGITVSDDFSSTVTAAVREPSNTATAIFPKGNKPTGGKVAVWYAINPMSIKDGSKLTMTVTTADSTYLRTTDATALNLTAGQTGQMDFDIKGEGHVSSHTAFAVLDNESAYTIPSIERENVSDIILYSHYANSYVADRSVDIIDGADAIASELINDDGTVEFSLASIPGNTLSGKKIQGSTNALPFTAALMYTETKPVDMNDYLDMYNAGLDIKIGDVVINKQTCGSKYVLKKAGELTANDTKATHASAGILFLDNSDTENNVFKYVGTMTFGADRIVIGRYRNMPQPKLLVDYSTASATTKYFYVSGDFRALNVELGCLNTTYGAFVNTGAGTSLDLCINLQDCTIFSDYFGLFRLGSDTNNGFKEIVADNCVLKAKNNLVNASSGGLKIASTLEKLKFSNCAICTYGGATKGSFSILSLNIELPNTEITFTGNTIYGFNHANGLFYSKTVKNITLLDNIFYNELSADAKIVNTTSSGAALTLENNWGRKSGDFIWTAGTTEKFTTYTPSTKGALDSTADFFGSGMDAVNAYFPSLIEGAGCDYETKTWINK